MKTTIHESELFPFYKINQDWYIDKTADIPLDVLHWIDSTMKDFEAVQEYLGRLMDKASES